MLTVYLASQGPDATPRAQASGTSEPTTTRGAREETDMMKQARIAAHRANYEAAKGFDESDDDQFYPGPMKRNAK
jgi:hypothetical protein